MLSGIVGVCLFVGWFVWLDWGCWVLLFGCVQLFWFRHIFVCLGDAFVYRKHLLLCRATPSPYQ